jgi:hypothetical protein
MAWNNRFHSRIPPHPLRAAPRLIGSMHETSRFAELLVDHQQ